MNSIRNIPLGHFHSLFKAVPWRGASDSEDDRVECGLVCVTTVGTYVIACMCDIAFWMFRHFGADGFLGRNDRSGEKRLLPQLSLLSNVSLNFPGKRTFLPVVRVRPDGLAYWPIAVMCCTLRCGQLLCCRCDAV